jgi:hypothetical protein
MAAAGDDQIEVRAEGWNHYVGRQIEQRWASPLRSWFPPGSDADAMLDWHWLFLQFVFPVPDPREFPELTEAKWTDDERSRLNRYFRHGVNLAKTTALSAQTGYEVSLPDVNGPVEITEWDTVALEAETGFFAMFRQCYSPDENASFKRIYDLVGREAHKAGLSPETLRAWKGAHNRMRGSHLDYLILARAAQLNLVRIGVAENSMWHPDRVQMSPEQRLSTILYGDVIHWGTQRTVVEEWDQEHYFWAMKRRFDALRVAVQLGHLYVGFAAVVGRATGELAADSI